MLAVKPVILLVKLPVPLPFSEVLLAIVGFGLVLQHTPSVEMVPPPSFVTFPPVNELMDVMLLIAVVVKVAN